jgi:hypothetical protein
MYSKYNEYSLRYSHFLGSSTEGITLYLLLFHCDYVCKNDPQSYVIAYIACLVRSEIHTKHTNTQTCTV